jgi:hypothetical protein
MIPYKTQLKGITSKKNTLYQTLTPRNKRREIALDALNLIIKDRIRPAGGHHKGETFRNGYWVNWELNNLAIKSLNPKNFQKNLLENLPQTCEVCERGMLMISKIRIGNTISPTDVGTSDGSKGAAKPFTQEELEDMENIYEGNCFEYDYPYKSNTLRNMANNLCVIIDKGKFTKEDARTDYLKLWEINLI